MEQVQKGNVRLYACGGGGLNIGRQLEIHRGQKDAGFATLDVAYIDTSRSNLSKTISQENCFLLEGMDGSGKVRSENYAEISNNIRQFLLEFRPGDLNVVISTAAGGSGSVIAPLIASELLAMDKPLVVISIGSMDTRLEMENTLKTLKSYDGIAKKQQAPVVMYYLKNTEATPRDQVDKKAVEAMMALCLLFSREHRELDSRDLYNFLRYSAKVSSFPAALSALSFVEKGNKLDDPHLGNVISVATLAKEGTATTVQPTPEYQCTGFVTDAIDPDVFSRMPMHYVVSDGIIPNEAQDIHRKLAELDEKQKALLATKQGKGVLSAGDNADERGIVL
jgi:hypothetical protein